METRRLAWSCLPATPVEIFADEPRVERPLETRGASHFFLPIHYEANYRYPLLVWLHGDGDDESQLQRIMPQISLRNYVAVSVAGTRRMPRFFASSALAGGSVATSRTGLSWGTSGDDLSLAADRVWEAVDLARSRANIHPDRIFLAGLEAGGTMALRIALSDPERFGGVASLDGPLPQSGCPFARVKKARALPMLLAAFRRSRNYATDHLCRDLRLLTTAGMTVTLRQYPGESLVSSQTWRDVDRWLMERVTSGGR